MPEVLDLPEAERAEIDDTGSEIDSTKGDLSAAMAAGESTAEIKTLTDRLNTNRATMKDKVAKLFQRWARNAGVSAIEAKTVTVEGVTSESPSGADKVVRDNIDDVLKKAGEEKDKVGEKSFANKFGEKALSLVLLAGVAGGLTYAALKAVADAKTGCYYFAGNKSEKITCSPLLTADTCNCSKFASDIRGRCNAVTTACVGTDRYVWLSFTPEDVVGDAVNTISDLVKNLPQAVSGLAEFIKKMALIALVGFTLYILYVFISRRSEDKTVLIAQPGAGRPANGPMPWW